MIDALNTENIEIVETKQGFATISLRYFKKNDILFQLEGDILTKPTKYTIQIGKNVHIVPKYGKYVNHSCMPSAYIDFENCCMRALVDIQPKTEITFNYNTSEYAMAEPFTCHCKMLGCIGKVKGFKYLNIKQQKNILIFLPKYLIDKI